MTAVSRAGTSTPTDNSDVVRVVADVARLHADAVDAAGVFPDAALAELRSHRLLFRDWSIEQASESVARVAAACASTGLIWAMHLAVAETLRRHAGSDGEVRQFVHDAVRTQPLIAGATSEAGIGGDIRKSRTALTPTRDGHLRLEKAVPFSSYLAQADAVVVTARRSEQSAPTDQVLILARRDQISIQPTAEWSALGMRGTSSGATVLAVEIPPCQVLETPFERICATSMVPLSHALWAACWLGIATDAAATARAYVRAQSPDAELAATRRLRLAEVQERLTVLRCLVSTAAREADGWYAQGSLKAQLRSTRFSNDTKVAASELAVDIVLRAFELVGAGAYLSPDQSPYSLSRHVRDVLSSKVMVSSDRIRTANGTLALLGEDSQADG